MTVAAATHAASAAASGSPAEWLRVALSLIAVVAMILVIAWFARRAQFHVRRGSRRLCCLEVITVGAKQKILLVQAGDKQLVVGASPAGLRTLAELSDATHETGGNTQPHPFASRAKNGASASRWLGSLLGHNPSNPSLAESFRIVLARWRKLR